MSSGDHGSAHAESDDPAATRGQGRTLVGGGFAGDDGHADVMLRAALVSGSDDLLTLLGVARLLVAVVAVADEVDAATGADKDSHMAVVSMVNAAGERGLLAFTGLDAMQAWDPAARPVPVTGSAAAQAALDDGNAALVLDVCGPHRRVVTGAELERLARQ